MDYRKMTIEELEALENALIIKGNLNAAVEVGDFIKVYDKIVKVIKGRKVPIGTVGRVFWVKRYNYGRYTDYWGIHSTTKVGIVDDEGNKYFTAIKNVEVIEGGE